MLDSVATAGLVGVWELESENEPFRCDANARSILGLGSSQELSLSAILALIHTEDREYVRRCIDKGQFPQEGAKARLAREYGDDRVILIRGERPASGGDAGSRMIGVLIDITDAARDRNPAVDTVGSTADGYYSLDSQGRFSYVSREAESILGVGRDQLLGRSAWDVSGIFGTQFEKLRLAIDTGRPVTFEEYYPPFDRWFELRAYPMAQGIGIGVYFHDITDRHDGESELSRLLQAEQRARHDAETAQRALAYQASHDSLTDLVNRGELMSRLESYIARGQMVTVLFIDLDRFKLVNDSLGHAIGDGMLEILAHRLGTLSAEGCTVARLGGDEFVIGLAAAETDDATGIANQVLEMVRDPVQIEGHTLNTTASIGIASSAGSGANAQVLLRDADVALYRAKETGGDTWWWFDEQARRDVLLKVEIERGLHDALRFDQLRVHYQPAYDLETGAPTNTECLLRWSHPKHGPISPEHFIPIAEESGLIIPIGDWVGRKALEEAEHWIAIEDHAIWINVSIRQLVRPGLADRLAGELERTGIDPSRLGIEITEWVFADHSGVIDELTRISDLGVRLAIDDFGTGFSSIARFGDLPVDVLKIDQQFIQSIETPSGMATVTAIVDLGHALDCLVIAEGVETQSQLDLLRKTECDQAGGFLFGRPVPCDEMPAVLGRGYEVLADAE